MRKSLSLMLAAALTVSSALSTVAAPLAQKAGGNAATAKNAAAAMKVENRKPFAGAINRLAKANNTKSLVAAKNEFVARRANAAKSATAAARALDAEVKLRGSVIYADSWEDAAYGIYNLPHATGGSFGLVGQNTQSAIQAGYIEDGVFYTCKLEWFWGIIPLPAVVTYDANTMAMIEETPVTDMDYVALDLAVDPVTGNVYGCTYNADGNGYQWSKIDYSSMTVTAITAMDTPLFAVGCDAEGNYYGLTSGGDLYSIDKTTGELEMIAMTDFSTDYLIGGCVNTANNTFLATYNTDDEAGLVEIDLEDGTTTTVAEFADGEEVTCVYIDTPAAADKAPAAPSMTVECTDGSLNAVVTLVMPTELFDGTPIAEGTTLNYTIISDGLADVTGTAAAGATVTETIACATSGVTTFKAYASNAEGKSPKAKASCYVGKGTPAAPKNVVLTWTDGVAALTWDAVTAASDGGYFDAADGVTYNVYDQDGNVVVKNLPNTELSFNVAEPTDTYITLSYSVSANYEGKSSTATQSNTLGLGAYKPAVDVKFNSADTFNGHFVQDVNGDGKTWTYNASGYAQYTYSTSKAADDWLFTPNFSLEAGKIYIVTASVAAYNASYAEKLEVFCGQGTTAEAMTTEVIPVQEFKSTTPFDIEGTVMVDADGIYNFGFHACSDANKWNIKLFSYSISDPMATTAPAAPTNTVVTRAANGDLKASIAYKAPKVDLAGNDLTGDVTVTVARNGETIKSVTGKAGANYSISDVVPAAGTYTYTFTATNANGETGLSAKATAFVGPTTPAGATNIKAYESNGTVNISWDAVTTDVDGNAIAPEYITYDVWSIVDGYLGEVLNDQPITATNFSFTIDTPDIQSMEQFAVQASNRGVAGKAYGTICCVGTPYELPALMGGLDCLQDYILMYGGNGELSLGTLEGLGVAPYEGEDYWAYKAAGVGAVGYLYFGKYHITGEKPVLTYYEYLLSDTHANETAVIATIDGVETVLKSYVENEELANPGEWNKVTIDLTPYIGKDLQLTIQTTCKTHYYNLYDEIKLAEAVNYDLKAVNIVAPATVETGAEFAITVNVKNEGAKAADAATVNLYRNGDLYATKTVENVAPEATTAVVFNDALGLHDGTSAEYSAEVVYDADQNTANNTTKSVVVSRKLSSMPSVTGLTGEATENGHELTWDAINLGEPQAVSTTETFEDSEDATIDVEGWTMLDLDGKSEYVLNGTTVPALSAKTSTWTVCNGAAVSESWMPVSGNNMIISSCPDDGSQANNWAISPALSGNEQTISFYAKAVTTQYGAETLKVYASYEDSVDPDDYEEVKTISLNTSEWTKFEVELEEGMKHFALVDESVDIFMIFIDDVTFERLEGVDAEHIGYNVYCDGQKINDELVTENKFTNTQPTGNHTYHVTAVYDKGESEISAPYTISNSGLAINKAGQLKVAVDGKTIVVAGTEGKQVTIATVDGKVLYNAAGDARFTATSAIYLVTVNGRTAKVIVR